MTGPFSYPEVGATAPDFAGPAPTGYSVLDVRTYLGDDVLSEALERVMTWDLHRGAGIRILPVHAPRAAPGVEVTCVIGVWPLRIQAPCRVIWVVDEPHRAGFGYGTLPGHPESGEESFLVERDPDGRTWLHVTAFSRPGRWYTRLAGPLVPIVQRFAGRRYGTKLRNSLRRV